MDAVRGIDLILETWTVPWTAMVKAGAKQATTGNFLDAEDTLPLEEAEPDALEEKPTARIADKKKARLRPRDSKRKIAVER